MLSSTGIIMLSIYLFMGYLNVQFVISYSGKQDTVSVPKEVYDVSIACLQRDNSLTNKSDHNECGPDVGLSDRVSTIESKFKDYEEDRQQLFNYFDTVTKALNRLMTLERECLNCNEMSKLISDVTKLQTEVGNLSALNLTDGKKGEKGEAGVKGDTGLAGGKGEKGKIGVTGDKGTDGQTGRRGKKGDKGDIGHTGLKGVDGRFGTKGDKGEIGQPGEKGSRGLKGEMGGPGEKGDRGAVGFKGEMGMIGVPGIKGVKGNIGPKGIRGKNGFIGEKGADGRIGRKGKKGSIGERGERGVDGRNGLTGEKGNKGIRGLKGQKGEKGEHGVYYHCCAPGCTGCYGTAWYYFSNYTTDWQSASNVCDSMDAHLAIITSKCENDYLVSEASKNHIRGTVGYFLDGTDVQEEGIWIWKTTKEIISYEDFAKGEPNNLKNEDCLELGHSRYKWNDVDCSTRDKQFICEKCNL